MRCGRFGYYTAISVVYVPPRGLLRITALCGLEMIHDCIIDGTTQSPISTVVLMLELTGCDRSYILPILLVAARTVKPRSIYDACLTDEEIAARQKVRELPPR